MLSTVLSGHCLGRQESHMSSTARQQQSRMRLLTRDSSTSLCHSMTSHHRQRHLPALASCFFTSWLFGSLPLGSLPLCLFASSLFASLPLYLFALPLYLSALYLSLPLGLCSCSFLSWMSHHACVLAASKLIDPGLPVHCVRCAQVHR